MPLLTVFLKLRMSPGWLICIWDKIWVKSSLSVWSHTTTACIYHSKCTKWNVQHAKAFCVKCVHLHYFSMWNTAYGRCECDHAVCANGLIFTAFPVSHSSVSVITVGLWKGFVLWITWGDRDNIWWGLQQNVLHLSCCCIVERLAAAECAWWHRVKYRSTLGRCFHLYKCQQSAFSHTGNWNLSCLAEKTFITAQRAHKCSFIEFFI